MLGDRSLFPSLVASSYFNHAAMSPPSTRVRDACAVVLDDYAHHGAAAWMRQAEQRDRLRARLAAMFRCQEEEIALIPGTGHAASMIALSVPWRPGDRILLLRGEFPANVTPWQQAAGRFGLGIEFLDVEAFAPGGDGLEQLEIALARGVRLLALSAVQFQTGLRMPLAAITAICRAHGTQVFVDAIQAAGCVPLDLGALDVDYLAAGGHKWLMGVEGAGFLFVRAARARELQPAIAGWLSHEDGTRFLFEGSGLLRYDRPLRRRADVFEVGVTNSLGFAALDASTTLLVEIGIDAVFAHIGSILDELEPELLRRGFVSARERAPEARSGILSVLPPRGRDLAALARGLAGRGVAVATPDGYLRFSPHWPNDVAQVHRIATALDEVLGEDDAC